MPRAGHPRTSGSSRSAGRTRRIGTRTEAFWLSCFPVLFNHIAAVGAEHQLTMEPEWCRALAEQRVVERPQRKRPALLLLQIVAQLQQRELADAVDQICRVERSALRFSPRARLLDVRF